MRKPNEPDLALTVEGVGISFGAQQVLKEVGFEAPYGKVSGILGPTGSGKTTILRILAGLLPLQSGRVSGAGESSFVFQQPNLVPWLSLIDNMRLTDRRSMDSTAREQSLEDWLKRFRLFDHREKRPHQLSGGQRQKCNLLRAFLADKNLVLMDEAFSSVDVGERARLYALFKEIQREHSNTVVVVTHDIDEALFLCDRVYFLSGRSHSIQSMWENSLARHSDIIELRQDPLYREAYSKLHQLYDADLGDRI